MACRPSSVPDGSAVESDAVDHWPDGIADRRRPSCSGVGGARLADDGQQPDDDDEHQDGEHDRGCAQAERGAHEPDDERADDLADVLDDRDRGEERCGLGARREVAAEREHRTRGEAVADAHDHAGADRRRRGLGRGQHQQSDRDERERRDHRSQPAEAIHDEPGDREQRQVGEGPDRHERAHLGDAQPQFVTDQRHDHVAALAHGHGQHRDDAGDRQQSPVAVDRGEQPRPIAGGSVALRPLGRSAPVCRERARGSARPPTARRRWRTST